MAVKQIQLRGISRTPSDRMTRDGGLAESLNMQLDGEELAPMRIPEDVTENLLGEGSSVPGKIVYIHKGNSFENYIELDGRGLYAWVDKERSTRIGTITEAVRDINSNGMVLIIITEAKAYYFIFKDGEYLSLGTEVPDPGLQFKVAPAYEGESVGQITLSSTYDTAIRNFYTDVWNKVISQPEANLTTEEKAQRADAFGVMSDAWDKASVMVDNNRQRKMFSMPVLARYGVRLYDGTYVNVSQPVYLGGGVEEWIWMEGSSLTSQVTIHLKNLFRAFVKADPEFEGFGNWKKLVQSVDVFLSDYVPFPAFDAKFRKVEAGGSSCMLYLEGTESDKHYKNSENAILAASNFYKIVSFSTDEIENLTEVDLLENPEMGSQSYRETQDRLREDSMYGIIPDAIMQYNGRVIAKGATYQIPNGYRWIFAPGAQAEATISQSVETLNIRYYLRDGGRVYSSDTVVLSHDSTYAGFGILFFPDSRCFGAWIEDSERATYYWVEMKEHPNLNCSYGFFGTARIITMEREVYAEDEPSSNGRLIPIHNKLLMTAEADSFIVYGLGNILTFGDDIIDAATIAKALITNPYGLADIYVFTKGGIFSIGLMHDGSFKDIHPYTRDVPIPGTLTMIDHAVVFITEKGVMLLSESGLQDISQVMRGKHDPLPGPAASLLDGDDEFRSLVPAATATEPFMAFMRDARAAYDYAGNRLIFFNDAFRYQYVFMLDSASWHKTDMVGADNYSILNSHPQCLIGASTSTTRTFAIMDFSTLLDDEDYITETGHVVKGLIATRPLAFDAPDIRKVLKDIRIRTQANRTDVKYILLASMDGKTWKRLTSRGGGSFKWFKIVLVTSLAPIERIGWLDVDVETRYTDKLR